MPPRSPFNRKAVKTVQGNSQEDKRPVHGKYSRFSPDDGRDKSPPTSHPDSIDDWPSNPSQYKAIPELPPKTLEDKIFEILLSLGIISFGIIASCFHYKGLYLSASELPVLPLLIPVSIILAMKC